ncbi:MAG: hypothetical protein AUJ98_06245 [Bacteroidetes bacterium CG2_30_33_31]|nr:MAG: hypothetical protein AUJ98_06245 [Bacteroidetes bacterium CG2_30_33_31]
MAIAQATLIHTAPSVFNGTSGSRAPNGTSAHAYFRAVTIVKASELSSGIPNNTSIKSFGFVYNTGASTSNSGTLNIYLVNTTDTTNLKSTTWATAITGMTLVYSGTYTVPATVGVSTVDVTLTTPYTYTGAGLYLAYDWNSTGSYATTGAIYQCNTNIPSAVKMATSATTAPTALSSSSSFRPLFRFGFNNPYSTDAAVVEAYTLGKLPIPFGNPYNVSAVIKNQGSDTLFGRKSYLNISGANTYSDSVSIDTLLPGNQRLVSFGNFIPTIVGANSVVVSLPSDQNNTNNSKTKSTTTTLNSYSYAQGSTPAGGVGFNGATGDFVAKFTTNIQKSLNQVDVNFTSSGNSFQIGVWNKDAFGNPDSLLYTSPTYISSTGVYTVLINPPVVIPAGSFFVGVRQLGTTNIGFAYQTESPIRGSSFYYAAPTGDSVWNDFAPDNAFRFMIEPKFALPNDVGVYSISPAASASITAGQTINLHSVIANYGTVTQTSVPVKYTVNGGTAVGPVNYNSSLLANDTASVYFSGAYAFTPATAGTYTIKIFTALSGDQSLTNDTMTVVYTVIPSSISSFPYIQTFDSAAGWTITGSALWNYSHAASAIPGVSTLDSAVFADFYNTSSGTVGMLVSPVFNISTLSNPLLKFHVAHRPYSPQDDSLQILVSTNYGVTFVPGSPALYLKSSYSNPPLSTKTSTTSQYVPADSSDWRLETISLSQFSSSPNIMIAFKATSDYGNNCWIDNVKITNSSLAVVSTSNVSNKTTTTLTSGGNVTDNGGAAVTARGVCYSTSANPTISSSHTTDSSGTGIFTSNLIGLTASTIYHIRAYATNGIGTAYGNEIIDSTMAVVLATVTTDTVTSITTNSATSGGNVLTDGGGIISAKGVCWSTSQNPTILDPKTTNGTGLGTYTSSIILLSPSTQYYVRAYATNSAGTAYGNQLSFTSATNTTAPVLTTDSISAITYTSATSGGNVISDGGDSVISRGICWSTLQNPTTADSVTINGSSTGIFTSMMSNLSPNTAYYVRAYATNSVGTSYGNEVTFTTLTPTLATVTTSAIDSITIHSAKSGGEVTQENGSAVTVYGVCWSTSANPTVTDAHTSDGAGIAIFSSSITGLTHSTTYHVRAYATNGVGTSYGNDLTFSTLVDGFSLPTVSQEIKIFNDGNSILIISLTSLPKGSIELFDLSGRLIASLKTNGYQNAYSLSTKGFAKGIYIAKFNSSSFVKTQKINVE